MNEAGGPAKTPCNYLKEAAIKGRLSVVQYFVDEIDDESVRAQCCFEAAKCAAEKGHLDVKDFLLQTAAKLRVSKHMESNAAQGEQKTSGPNTCPFAEKWDEVRLIGRGGFGEVHEVLTDIGTTCAVKVIKPKVELGDDTHDVINRTIQAERNLCQLQHENIVQFLYITQQQPATVVVFMELLDGRSLERFIGGDPLENETISEFCLQICSALAYMHSQQPPVIHRDINCSNIIVLADRIRIKLIDFGLSIKLQQSVSHFLDAPKGNQKFMAPELLESDSVQYSRRSDIWAFGCSVYQMASCQRPKISGAPNLPDSCSDELRDFYGCCTALDPQNRQSAEELMGHEFLAAAASEGPNIPLFLKTWDRIRLLSRGGSDEVHEVRTDTGSKCATKTLKLPVQQGAQLNAGNNVGMNLQSDKKLCRLRHEIIVRFFHIAQPEPATVVVFMELLSGRTLEQFIDKKPLDVRTVRDFSKQICSALAYMHSLNEPVIHRDINCSNIFVLSGTTGKRVKLIDFGLAIKLEQSVTHAYEASRTPKGTLNFMAPELLAPDESNGSKYSRGSDIWAFGCSAYQMASGAIPHAEERSMYKLAQVLEHSGAPALPGGCSEELRHFYGCCTAQDRRNRKSATELMEHHFLTAA